MNLLEDRLLLWTAGVPASVVALTPGGDAAITRMPDAIAAKEAMMMRQFRPLFILMQGCIIRMDEASRDEIAMITHATRDPAYTVPGTALASPMEARYLYQLNQDRATYTIYPAYVSEFNPPDGMLFAQAGTRILLPGEPAWRSLIDFTPHP